MGLGAAVLGASGFAGGELLRILLVHPAIDVAAAFGGARAGDDLAEVHPHLGGAGMPELRPLHEAASAPADVCFSCLPSGRLQELGPVPADVVVDLSDDFRADTSGTWVLGLTELARSAVASATRIANPGCYPTASLLSLVPFAHAGAVEGPVMIDAMSGFSGAGRQTADHLGLAAGSASVGAYGTTRHRHVPEMERGLALWGGLDTAVSFTPHLVPMARGLLTTTRARLTSDMDDEDALELLRDAYAHEPFVEVVPGWPATKAVCGTNRAHVSARVDGGSGLLICSAAIDNLGKGAAGQAVQNANLALGLDETAGLAAHGVWP